MARKSMPPAVRAVGGGQGYQLGHRLKIFVLLELAALAVLLAYYFGIIRP